MKYYKQLFNHDPKNGLYGDCHRTAIACILDKHPSEVPHFYDKDVSENEAASNIEDWFLELGMTQIHILYPGDTDLDDILSTISATNWRQPDMHYLLGGRSKNGCGHTVVCKGDKIVWDPSQDDSGIHGPMSDGFYWITFFGSLSAVSSENLEAA